MLLFPTKPRRQPEPDERLHGVHDLAPHVTANMMRRCWPLAPGSEQSDRVRRLLAAQAWTDAALALVEIEAPEWTLRQLTYDDGQWHCTLGRHRGLPEWLEDNVEASHDVLPLAILGALTEALPAESAANRTGMPVVARQEPAV